jgi:tripartite-type tricarboxylate transporter receptor subunit TctC
MVQLAAAQTYPSQPIRMIAPFPPGGSVDITARLIADPLANQLGTRIIIDNRSGASGNIGMEAAARAPADGYTIVLNTIPLVTNQALFDKLSWDPIKDFTPIGMVATSPHVLVVPTRLAVNTVEDLVRIARERPGKLSYASAGVGTTFHLCGEMFKDSTKTFILHVPYRGGGPAINDLIGGHASVSFQNLGSIAQHVRSGKLKALAVTSDKRAAALPDVPTMAEAGVPDLQVYSWQAAAAPRGLPPEVRSKLEAEFAAAARDPSVKAKFDDIGFEVVATNGAQFSTFLDAEIARWKNVIETGKITATQ